MDRAAPPGPVPSGRASEWRLCWICYPGIRGTPDRRRRESHGQLPSTHETTRSTGNRSRGQRRIPLPQRPPRPVFLDGITADFPLKPLAAREAEHRFTPLTAPVDEGERTARMTVGGAGSPDARPRRPRQGLLPRQAPGWGHPCKVYQGSGTKRDRERCIGVYRVADGEGNLSNPRRRPCGWVEDRSTRVPG